MLKNSSKYYYDCLAKGSRTIKRQSIELKLDGMIIINDDPYKNYSSFEDALNHLVDSFEKVTQVAHTLSETSFDNIEIEDDE